ncbi:hypothetical protein FNV43_RR04609 [Rhamnella rubrinervis]|uniref:Uncharacterized protein n=1 Tax=Rhamnella rubrinervis TaxID=2594499 RepID=A0A8K0MPX9_9ROSA|nr:hypothetical protein FNV43_RR04609 [Rhamnella rubrinervis]
MLGIGVAICDPRDNLIFEVRKPLIANGQSKTGAEAKALIEGLNAALALELKRIVFTAITIPLPIHTVAELNLVNGIWPARQHKIEMLINQSDFSVDGCLHRYCFSCMKQHVEVKLLHGMLPKCPSEGCKSELNVESCGKFLTPKCMETMRQRIKEASTPVSESLLCISKCTKCNHMIELAEGCYHMTCSRVEKQRNNMFLPLWEERNILHDDDEDEDDEVDDEEFEEEEEDDDYFDSDSDYYFDATNLSCRVKNLKIVFTF